MTELRNQIPKSFPLLPQTLLCLLNDASLLHGIAVRQLQYYVGTVTQEAVAISGVPDGAP
jgi:hypothetical protein